VDVHEKLDELTAALESARAMPMSASCIVNRGEILALIDDIRELLPEEFRHAQMLLETGTRRRGGPPRGRQDDGGSGRRQAALVSETDIRVVADREAEESARPRSREAEQMRGRSTTTSTPSWRTSRWCSTDARGGAPRREKLRGHHDLEGYEDAGQRRADAVLTMVRVLGGPAALR
jgi:hypothetical protein